MDIDVEVARGLTSLVSRMRREVSKRVFSPRGIVKEREKWRKGTRVVFVEVLER